MEIYVGNLPPTIRVEELQYLFQHFGPIIFIDIKYRCPPQFAFVLFDNSSSAFNAVQASQNLVYNGYQLQVRLLPEEIPNQTDKECDRTVWETQGVSQESLQHLQPMSMPMPAPQIQQMSMPMPAPKMRQMPMPASQILNQLVERDKLAAKKNKNIPFHRTLITIGEKKPAVVTVPQTSTVSGNCEKPAAMKNTKADDLPGQTLATIKILTPEMLNKTVQKEKSSSSQQQNLKPIKLNPIPKRKKKKPLPTPPEGTPGGFDDPYRKGLTTAGIKWYLRYLSAGIPQEEARLKAGEHTHLARGVNDQMARQLSKQQFVAAFR